jgi:hypothetical protein
MNPTKRPVVRSVAVLAIAVLVAGAESAWAQSTATLQGTITDAQGAIVPGVSVVVRNQDTGVERTVVSDARRWPRHSPSRETSGSIAPSRRPGPPVWRRLRSTRPSRMRGCRRGM